MSRILLFCCLLLALAACQGATPIAPTAIPTPAPTQTPEPTATPNPPTPTPFPDPFTGEAQVGDYKLTLYCYGKGEPTIIFENGLDYDSFAFALPFGAGRQCNYSRPGMNGETAQGPRTTLDQVKDLHSLLQQTGVPGPYILVGHSIAGANLVLYTNQYPKDVVGLVCVDCRYSAFADILLEKVKPLIAADPEFEKQYGNTIKQETLEKDPNSWKYFMEQLDIGTSAAQVLKVTSLGDIPFVILVSVNEISPDALDYKFKVAFQQARIEASEKMSKLSTQSRVEQVPDTTHVSILTHPAVKKAVLEVYAKVK